VIRNCRSNTIKSATAAPAASDKPFKFAMTNDGGKVLNYLVGANGASSTNPANALSCVLQSGSLKCGTSPSGPFDLGPPSAVVLADMAAFVLEKGRTSSGWSLNPTTNRLTWGSYDFSFRKNYGAQIWVEKCKGHGHIDEAHHGQARAVFA
jgi:hypothetical protein